MFTGIIETIGTIREIRSGSKSITIGIAADTPDFTVATGGSVAVDGACLTLESARGNVLYFTAVAETLSRTTLARKTAGSRVNLERALLLSSRLDGHFVLGHVDAIGTIRSDRREGDSVIRTLGVPHDIMRYMAEKGSVAIDGVSLTIANMPTADMIAVSVIPFSFENTVMSSKRAGDTVNIECDVIARYCARLLAGNDAENKTSLLDKMERSGF